MSHCQKKQLSVEVLTGYAPEIGRWLWALEDTRQRTLQSLEGMDPAAIDWTASPESDTIGALLYHIAAIEVDWLYADILVQDFPPEVKALFPCDVRDDQGRLTPVQAVGLEEHLDRLAATRAFLLASFQGIAAQELRRLRSLADYDVTPEWVLYHLMQHEAEHRGQIAELRARAEWALRARPSGLVDRDEDGGS